MNSEDKMKITYSILFFFLITNLCLSQPDDFRTLMDQYSGEDGFVVININDASTILKDQVKSKSGRDAIKTIKKLMMVSFTPETVDNNKTAIEKGKQFYQTVRKYRPSGYEELMSLTQGKNTMRAFFKRGDNGNEFIMAVTTENESCFIIYMGGQFTKEQITEIAESISKKG